MTVLVGGTLVSAATAGVLGATVAGATAGLGVGVLGSAVGVGTASLASGAAGASAAAGAILGSVFSAGASGIVGGAVAGAITAAASNAGTAALGGAATISTLSGTLGSVVLGATETQTTGTYTFDCWKLLLHDETTDPSDGKLLQEVIDDPRIKQATALPDPQSPYPQITLQNIWDEQFRIEFFSLSHDQLAAHAVKI